MTILKSSKKERSEALKKEIKYVTKLVRNEGYKGYDLAIKELDKILAVDNNCEIALYIKGNVHLKLGHHASCAERNTNEKYKEYQKAIEYFDKVLELNPRHTAALLNKGFALRFSKRYGEALGCCEKILEINPDNSDASFFKGLLEDRISMNKKITTLYKNIIELDSLDFV